MPDFRSVGPTVQPAECKRTDTQMLLKILPLPLTREIILGVLQLKLYHIVAFILKKVAGTFRKSAHAGDFEKRPFWTRIPLIEINSILTIVIWPILSNIGNRNF